MLAAVYLFLIQRDLNDWYARVSDFVSEYSEKKSEDCWILCWFASNSFPNPLPESCVYPTICDFSCQMAFKYISVKLFNLREHVYTCAYIISIQVRRMSMSVYANVSLPLFNKQTTTMNRNRRTKKGRLVLNSCFVFFAHKSEIFDLT